MQVSLLARVPAACASAGLPERAGASVAEACASALPVLLGEGVGEHLARSARAGATLNTALIESRTAAFAQRGLPQLPAEQRRRWAAAPQAERYAMMIAHAAETSPKVASI